MIPREFFVTSGKAFSPTSELNAFDLALRNAGIAQCNLIPVTSILPPGCVQREPIEIPIGAITCAVIARMDGSEGENIGAAIAWGWDKGGDTGLWRRLMDVWMRRLCWKIQSEKLKRWLRLGRLNWAVSITNSRH